MNTHSRPSFAAVDVMIAAIPLLKVLVERIKRQDKDLADQIRRAANSVVLNLAESRSSTDGNRSLRARTAFGSLHEVRAGLRAAKGWSYVDSIDEVDAQLDRVAAMTWRLARR